MIIKCPNCFTSYSVARNRIRHIGSRVRCSGCKLLFTVFPASTDKNKRRNRLRPEKAQGEKSTIISITNQKGGVAKTTTCLNLGISLALLNKRILLVDFDVQSNLTMSLGCKTTNSFWEILHFGSDDPSQFVIGTKYKNLSLLPSNSNLMLLNKKYFGAHNFEFFLKHWLQTLNTQYDFILIDTPPSIDFFTINALTAADMAIIPSQCEFLSTHGAGETINFIKLIKINTNARIASSILVTMYHRQDSVSDYIVDKLTHLFGEKTFKTMIERDDKVRESQIMQMPVIFYDKNSSAGLEYMELAKEILQSRRKSHYLQ
jgi:chromosome partitioning protein